MRITMSFLIKKQRKTRVTFEFSLNGCAPRRRKDGDSNNNVSQWQSMCHPPLNFTWNIKRLRTVSWLFMWFRYVMKTLWTLENVGSRSGLFVFSHTWQTQTPDIKPCRHKSPNGRGAFQTRGLFMNTRFIFFHIFNQFIWCAFQRPCGWTKNAFWRKSFHRISENSTNKNRPPTSSFVWICYLTYRAWIYTVEKHICCRAHFGLWYLLNYIWTSDIKTLDNMLLFFFFKISQTCEGEWP